MTRESTIAGWGRLGVPGQEILSEDLEAITRDSPLTRGLGRSYGDAALPPRDRREIAGSRRADRILSFDSAAGRLRGEAGLSLEELNRILLPRGWFVPVSPGTEYVTLGGMVAADIHGKNHHRKGTVGRHVRELTIRTPERGIVTASREENLDLFRATLGGMGLTGHILEVALEMQPVPTPWIFGVSQRFDSLSQLAEALTVWGEEWPFTAAWVDGTAGGGGSGRGILFAGRWAEPEEAPREPGYRRRFEVPFEAPEVLLNRASIRLFNAAYFRRHPRARREELVDHRAFFYPLDAVGSWNRLYGRRGMTQYQCVIPAGSGAEGLLDFWGWMRRLDAVPFLAVLKDFGAEGEGVLSFPRSGFTFALDFPVTPETPSLVGRLNGKLRDLGGRVYLAKDAFTTAEDFAAMEAERLDRFLEIKARWDPEATIRSRLSERLDLVP
ncbi:MAG: FAD-binding oxidoreductase [Thermoanaerobaculia bacterium]|nr:FAD-binding oxidoreductase [Thermoanaerobaculia bacterium]